MASSLDCCQILSCQEQTLKQIRSMLTGAEPSMHARARVNGREPATKELALWKALREACSRDGHLLRAESVVVTHSHSSPCSANRSTGCFSVQSSVLSRVAKSVTYTYKNPDFIFHWEHKSITAAWLMSSADEKKGRLQPREMSWFHRNNQMHMIWIHDDLPPFKRFRFKNIITGSEH